ncbi:head-tail connector protein [Marinilactibacillus sp. XAAS-LB27]|uniref:head-tail connector protein n=1 Tax=Marinilactibacillus sp. XAAS-LB27 TaxID=3114538 RepID=UPI002E18EAAD|nr:head-tail connector protein [Marinilactibacillus sp. XAAS-LB27]
MLINPNTDLDEIKIDIKVDHDDDDRGVKRAAISAIAYIKGAIGINKPSFYTENSETVELLNTAIIMLTDHYYNARSATIESSTANGTLREYDLGFTSILLQLKGKYASFEEGDLDVSQ